MLNGGGGGVQDPTVITYIHRLSSPPPHPPGHVVSYFHLDLNEKRSQTKKGGGSQMLGWMYAKGGEAL